MCAFCGFVRTTPKELQPYTSYIYVGIEWHVLSLVKKRMCRLSNVCLRVWLCVFFRLSVVWVPLPAIRKICVGRARFFSPFFIHIQPEINNCVNKWCIHIRWHANIFSHIVLRVCLSLSITRLDILFHTLCGPNNMPNFTKTNLSIFFVLGTNWITLGMCHLDQLMHDQKKRVESILFCVEKLTILLGERNEKKKSNRKISKIVTNL